MGSGGYIDSTNADTTQAMVHSALGEKEGLQKAANFEQLFNNFEMIGEADDKDI